MNAMLKEEQDQRINTGANRKTTWMASAPGGHSNEDILSLVGNSAKAELAARQRAMNVSTVTSSGLNLLLLISDFERWPSGMLMHFPNQLQQLGDGLIGATTTQNLHHSILRAGKYGVVVIQYLEGKNMVTEIYVARSRCFVKNKLSVQC